MNKLICITLFTLFSFSNITAQSLSLSFGPIFTKSKAISPIINANEDFSNTSYVKAITYEHFINKKRISVLGAYFNFPGSTYIKYQIGGVFDPFGNSVSAEGFSGIDIHKIDLLVAYNLLSCNRFYLKPFIGLGGQISKVNGWELLHAKIEGPDYFEQEPMIAEPYNTFQITPTGGIKTGFVFWKRLDIGLQVQGVYGYKPYQKLILKYNYKGVPQPDAIYASDGTGFFWTLSLGYRFAKLIKD